MNRSPQVQSAHEYPGLYKIEIFVPSYFWNLFILWKLEIFWINGKSRNSGSHPWTHTLLKILMSKIKLAIFDMIKSWERNIRTLARYFLLKFLKGQTLFSSCSQLESANRAVARGGLWRLQPPQCSTDQVTLFQPGGQIMPTTVLLTSPLPPIFRACDGPAFIDSLTFLL